MFIETSGRLTTTARNTSEVKYKLYTGTGVLTTNWSHVAVIHDGIQPTLYINGEAVAQTFFTDIDRTFWFNDLTGLDNADIATLDYYNNANLQFFNGELDDIRIYDRALTEPEIQSLYNESSGTCSTLWKQNGDDIFYNDGKV